LTLENSSSTVFSLEATTNVGGGQNSLVAVTGNLTLNGSPSLLINPIGTLVNGTYTLMTYTGTLIGSFGSVQTVASPDGYVPGSGYNYTLNTSTPHVVQLVVGDAPNPGTFVAPYTISGSTLTWAGTGGTPSGTYRLYTTTNISTPLTNWTLVGSNSFDGSGNFSFPITMSNGPAHFFILKEP
jgi:hypothetical protein